ncbi:MAG: hypothetical protein LAO21_15125 [Acidobacteriia bacterium]|nr:hypothetical protein [Terriglobia bacterium]
MSISIDLRSFYTDLAKIADLEAYKREALSLAGSGNTVILTGQAPVWLYLVVAHALHGKAKRLVYRSPALVNEKREQVDIVIFDHDAF